MADFWYLYGVMTIGSNGFFLMINQADIFGVFLFVVIILELMLDLILCLSNLFDFELYALLGVAGLAGLG